MNEEASAGEKGVQSSKTCFHEGLAVPEDSGNIGFAVLLDPWKNPPEADLMIPRVKSLSLDTLCKNPL